MADTVTLVRPSSARAFFRSTATAERKENKYRILILGDSGVGKTSLMRKCNQKPMKRSNAFLSLDKIELSATDVEPTVAVDLHVKEVSIQKNETQVQLKINLWDFSGHPQFQGVRVELYKESPGESQAALLVFDVTNRSSFEHLPHWVAEATKHGASPNTIYIVCGNKTDVTAGRREVTRSEAKKWSTDRGMAYWECSAHTGANATEVFDHAIQALYDAHKSRPSSSREPARRESNSLSPEQSAAAKFQSNSNQNNINQTRGTTRPATAAASSSPSLFSDGVSATTAGHQSTPSMTTDQSPSPRPSKAQTPPQRSENYTSDPSASTTSSPTAGSGAGSASSYSFDVNLNKCSVRELQSKLRALGVSFAECVSKDDLLQKLRRHISKNYSSASNANATSKGGPPPPRAAASAGVDLGAAGRPSSSKRSNNEFRFKDNDRDSSSNNNKQNQKQHSDKHKDFASFAPSSATHTNKSSAPSSSTSNQASPEDSRNGTSSPSYSKPDHGHVSKPSETKVAGAPAAASSAAGSSLTDKEKDLVRERILREVRLWGEGRHISQLLNAVHRMDNRDYDSIVASGGGGMEAVYGGTLKETSPFSAINKAYKRALLKIHPDKHDQNDFETHFRATETFKLVHESFMKYQNSTPSSSS